MFTDLYTAFLFLIMSPGLFVEPHYQYGLEREAIQGKEYYSVLFGDYADLKQSTNPFGLPAYGRGEIKFLVGNQVALDLSLRQGFSLNRSTQSVQLHWGVEFFNLDWSAGLPGRWHLAYWPMVGVGPQIQLGSCWLLGQIRGGGGLDSGRQQSLRATSAYGANLYLDCPQTGFFTDWIRAEDATSWKTGFSWSPRPQDDFLLNYSELQEKQIRWQQQLSLSWRRWFDF